MRHRVACSVIVALALAGAAVSAAAPLTIGQPAPEIAGAGWINSPPLTLAALRGRVVLIDFWTYGCINCQHVIPQLRAWDDRYRRAGLTIVGVHTPEFLWEKSHERVAAATKRFEVSYPVVQDNDYAIWNRFGIRAWPTTVVVDKKGIIRHQHIGEGSYEETESVIRHLLAESE